jgi:hypothetical protein
VQGVPFGGAPEQAFPRNDSFCESFRGAQDRKAN